MKATAVRRSGIAITVQLIGLLGNLIFIMLLAVLNGSLGFLSAMGVPLMGGVGVAKALGEAVPLSWGWIGALAIGCGLLRGLLRYIEQYSNHFIAFKLLAVLRDRIFSVLRILCPAKLETKQKGNLIAMLTSDIETLEVFYAHTLSPICIALLVSTLVLMFIGWVGGPILAGIALIAYLTIGIAVPLFFSHRTKAIGVVYRNEFADFNAFFMDSIRGIKEILFNNADEARKQAINARSDSLLAATHRLKTETSRATAFTEAAVSFFILLSAAVGIALVHTGQLSAGKWVLASVAFFGSFGPVLAISALPGNLNQTFAAGDRVLNLLAEKPAVIPNRTGSRFHYQRLQVSGLCFGYDPATPILNGVDFVAEPGEIIGIIGESGCGKSTFLKLLLRFWNPTGGSVRYNGIDIADLQSDSLLQNVTLVPQTTYLFDNTIEYNLTIAKPDATPAEITEACQMASVHDFIMSLPNAYQTPVGTMGDSLSAGEKQRIGLARAFLTGCPLILLDEPTGNVDSINEGIILKALAGQKQKKTIILVSHRESTIAIADRVYRLEQGRMTPVR